MTKKSDAPAIRFKGFSDAWEQRKLSEITDKVTEKNAGLQYVETFTNSAEFGIISQRDFFDHDIAKLGSLDGYYIVKTEDFVYNPRISTSAPVGPINRNKLGRTGVMSPLYTVFRPHDIDTTYLEYFFKCGYWHSFMNFNGDSGARSDRFSIRDNVFFQMPIPIPDIDEQRKIGELLTCLDNLITLHQRKFEKLTNVKKSMLEKMFPQNGSSYPEIRFKGFTDPWEQRKLASLCEKFTDGDWIESKDQSDFGVRLVQTGNVGVAEYLDKPNNKKWISEDTFDRLHCEEVLPGDILISRLPEPAGRACIVPLLGTKMITAVDCTIVRTAPDMSNKFLVQYLSSQAYFDDVNTCLAGGTRQRISRGNLANFNVPIPVKKSEQDAIGMFFGYLDNLITLHQRKCIFFTGRAGRLISTVNKKRITSSWEQRKLGDMMNVTSVKRIHQSDWTDSGVRFLRARDIVAAAKNEEPDDYLYISKEKYEEYSTLSGKVGVSDLLVTGVGTIGVPYLVRNLEPLYFKDGNIIWFQNSDKIDGKFLFYSFSAEQIQGFINESAGIGTVGTYTIESGKKTPISLPNQIEQAKVGEFFQQLDNLITLHQRKFEKLTNVKKSMLEKMFPQNGSSYPEIRFKGFTDPWEQRKLASLCEKFTDGDWIESKDQSDFGVRLVQTGNVGVAEYLDKPNNKKWISEDTFDRLHCEEVLPGDILISRLPEPAGRACIVPLLGTKMITAVDCTIVRTAPDMSNKFLVQYLSSQAYFDDVNTCLAGGTRQRISRGNLANFNVPIPVKKSEQDAIGMFFGYLDNLITLHQRELEKLQNIKKSMLEKMFV